MNSDGVFTRPESTIGLGSSNMDSTIRRSDEGEELSSDEQIMDVGLSKKEKQQQPHMNAQAQHQECIPFLGCSASSGPPAAAPTSHGSKARLLSPFAIPSKRYYGNRTRLVHGRVRVVDADKFLVNTKIYFDLQDKNDDELRFPILMAVKHWKTRKYDIFDISWDADTDGSNMPIATGDQQDANNNKVGTLEKMLSFHVGKISYKLCNDSGEEETRISYRLHNPIMDKVVIPGRKCELVLLTDEGKKKLITSNDFEDELKKQKAKDDDNSNSDNKTTSTNNNNNNNDNEQPKPLLHRLFSKIPDTRNADQQFALDFKGRGRQTSTKNAQLVDKGDVVVLQMAKVDNGIFHVDYRAPCTALHAFAYALAQLDL